MKCFFLVIVVGTIPHNEFFFHSNVHMKWTIQHDIHIYTQKIVVGQGFGVALVEKIPGIKRNGQLEQH